MTTRLVTREVTESPTRLAAGLPIPLLLMPLQTDLRLLRGTGSATFTRSTIGTFVDKDDGLVKTAAIDAARFEQNGILIEGASTNLLLRSEEFDNAAWTKFNGAVVTGNFALAPDGTMTADKVAFAADQLSRIEQAVTAQIGVDSTTSIYVRSDDVGAKIRISVQTISADIIVTSSFQRIDFTQVPTGTTNSVQIRNGSDGIARNIEIWGGQKEDLPFASSYIKTVASTVTKTDEDTDIDAANIPAPTADYTVSMEVDAIGFDSTLSQVLFNVAGETSRRIAWNTTTGAIEATHGAVTSVSTSTFSAGDRVKISFAVDATNQTLYINSIQEDQDAKGTVTGTATAINIGHQAGVNQAFSHIKPLRIDNAALTAAQVGAL